MPLSQKIGSVRKANTGDVEEIFSIINRHAAKEVMLERNLENIYDTLRDFFVIDSLGIEPVSGDKFGNGIAGVCSLHIWGSELAEIRSLAVVPDAAGLGVGSQLVAACLKEARTIGLKKVFALTYVTGFFEHVGFYVLDKERLPQKIWGDCAICHKFPSCDETAVAIELC